MNKRKELTSKQHGIDRFFLNPKRPMKMRKLTKQLVEKVDKYITCVQAITASSTAGISAACEQPVEPSIIIDLCKLRCMNLKLCTVKNKQY